MKDELVQQAAKLQTATRMDEGTKTEFLDCCSVWVQICDEVDEVHKRTILQEGGLKQCV